jgi:glycogen synthase
MKLLIYSPAFLPQIGGLELNVGHLAEELIRLGHRVTVVTTTLAAGPDHASYHIVRRPGPIRFLRWVLWCDLFHQANISLKGLWPLLLVRRPWVVSHHSWYRQGDGRITWRERLKRRVLRYAAGSIAVSRSIAADLPDDSVVIENCYRDELFRLLPEVRRDQDLLFVGRLVSDKGVDLLLNALARMARAGCRPRLLVVGDGPEAPALRKLVERHGLEGQVAFSGTIAGEDLVEVLNRHRILVVPSRYQEPFGIVALEGIACGCVVVGSAGGGLSDAIGPCGLLFPNGDESALADALERLLSDESLRSDLWSQAGEHLFRHRSAVVTAAYLEVFERALVRSEVST